MEQDFFIDCLDFKENHNKIEINNSKIQALYSNTTNQFY